MAFPCHSPSACTPRPTGVRRLWLHIKLRIVECLHDDATATLRMLDHERPFAQARVKALEDRHNAILRQLFPLQKANNELSRSH